MQEFQFKMFEDETYAAIGYEGDEAEVTIPAVWLGKPVTILFDDLFRGHAEIKKIHIPDSVTDIGCRVFDGCTGLTQIDLPPHLTELWQYAFARSSVEEIVLPDGIRSIAPYAFKDCQNLRRFVCNPGLKKIYGKAFEGCFALVDFTCGPDVDVSPHAFI